MDMGRQQLIFPGEGEVEMVLPPGSVVAPLVAAPSGRQCMIIDEYDRVPTEQGGIATTIPPLKLSKGTSSGSGTNGTATAVADQVGSAETSR